jgi:N-acetyl-gamma-glutamyl-phosphate reductase
MAQESSQTSAARVRVGVAGGSGYTGLALLDRLAEHERVEVVFATARSEAGRPSPVPGLDFADLGPEACASVDVLFCCLPHGTAVEWVRAARDAGIRVIDLTADHRPGSGREGGIVYGLAERAGEALPDAMAVANPGCYPTGVILSLAPLLEAGWIDESRPISIHASSGVTGAGRTPKRDLLFAEVFGDYRPYGLGNEHRHLLEMRACLPSLQLLFVPHLLPVARGIVETISVGVRPGVDAARVRERWAEVYATSPSVRVRTDVPSLRAVASGDELHLAAFDNAGLEAPTLTVVTAFDNLGKGAAGQAVQNMNLMLGFDPGEGLRRARS